MRFYNAAQASKAIGISDKTMRRWLQKGRITATRTKSGKLAIAETEVERARLEWAQEQAQFTHSGPIPDITDASSQVADLTARVTSLEEKFVALETHLSDRDQKGIGQTRQSHVKSTVPTSEVPLRTSTDPNSGIPDDWMLCSDFFSSLSIKETTWRRYLTNGIAGDFFEFEEKPRAGTTQRYRYFSYGQQQKALYILKRHGKLTDS